MNCQADRLWIRFSETNCWSIGWSLPLPFARNFFSLEFKEKAKQ